MVVLKRKSTTHVLSFLSCFAYSNTLKRTSQMLAEKPSDIKRWNLRTVSEIKSLLIKRGVNINNISIIDIFVLLDSIGEFARLLGFLSDVRSWRRL